MRAVQLDTATLDLRLREVPVPAPRAGQVRVRVHAAGVCLSDVHLVSGALRSPRGPAGVVTLGHEMAGTVDACADDVVRWAVGDRVVIHPIMRSVGADLVHGMDVHGGWADHVIADAAALVSVPDGYPFLNAAVIPDAVSTPWAAVNSTARVRAGQSAAVWGVGGLGYHAIKALRLVGGSPVLAVDPLPEARERALQGGADGALDPLSENFQEQVKVATGGRGVDHAFDVVGAPGVREQALETLAQGGQLTIVGAGGQPFTVENVQRLIVRNQRIVGHFASSVDDLRTLVDLIIANRLDLSSSVTATYPLEGAIEAVQELHNKSSAQVRIVLDLLAR